MLITAPTTIKIVAKFGLSSLRSKNGIAIEPKVKTLPTIRICRYCKPRSNTRPSAPCQRKKSSAKKKRTPATNGVNANNRVRPVARICLAPWVSFSPWRIDTKAPVPTPTSMPRPRIEPITGQATLIPARPSAPTKRPMKIPSTTWYKPLTNIAATVGIV